MICILFTLCIIQKERLIVNIFVNIEPNSFAQFPNKYLC